MPLKLYKHTAVLSDAISVEESGDLAEWLRRTPEAELDLEGCSHLHTAALQAILSARPRISRPPTDEFLSRWVLPLLADVA